MKILMLHLSDIHITERGSPVLERYPHICATLRAVLPDVEALFIVVTGDIAYSGNEKEYAYAKTFFQNLIDAIDKEFNKPIHVVMVPGNHDGEFKNGGNARQAIIEKVREKGESYIDEDVINQCSAPQKHYFNFEDQLSNKGRESSDPLWKEYRFNVGSKVIGFSSINASWMSQVPEEAGKLIFPVKKYASVKRTNADIRIALLHHPLNWYAQDTYHPLRDLCQTNYQVVMTGHEHVSHLSLSSDCVQSQNLNVEASALVSENGKDSGFTILKIDLEKNRFAKESFSWRDSMYLPDNGTAIWDAFSPLPESRPNNHKITDEMKERLETLGATFSHPNVSNLKLSDVFVYPDLQEMDSEEDGVEVISSDVLAKQIDSVKKVLILGDDQYGKTSVLLHLFQQYHAEGYVPILLDGKDLGGATEEQFARIVMRHVTKQYGENSQNQYAQTELKYKIALVDNIDKAGVRGDVVARVVSYLSNHFGCVIVTAGDRFDVTYLSSKEASSALSSYETFRMLGFGYKLRNELIRRWYQAGTECSPTLLQEKVHAAEQVINSILGKGLVPMTAFNVLILLQTIEVNQKGALANAGLAQYYEYLIRQNLIDAKVRNDELDEIFSYLSFLAWEMYRFEKKLLSEQELAEFNIYFSNKVHRTSLVERLATLEKAKILVKKDDGYVFSYSYLRYFFVAKYVSDHLEDEPELKPQVERICRHLYLKENANIVLFLTHHSHSKWIVREISAVLSELLSDVEPLRLETDTALLNTWVSERARVAVDVTDMVANQNQVRKKDDSVATYKEPELTTELGSIKELDKISQLNLLFKTSEILGQILKGRYGSITKDVKAGLVKDLFDAPLRGINFFLSLVNSDPDALVQEISNKIQAKVSSVDKQRADRVAKRFVFSTLGAVADSFLSRQGEIIGSPKLTDSIEQVAAEDGGLAYNLMSISAQLSYPNHAPTEKIRKLAEQLDTNYFGYKILQGLVARHMYMFSLAASERHALSSAVGIDIHGQRDIELKSGSYKKLPNKQSDIKHPKSLIARLQESFLANNETIRDKLKGYSKKKESND